MSEFKPFEDKLAGLIGALSPAGRRKLAANIAKEMRRSQQQRIRQQKAPDGTSYQARKRQPLRGKSGRIKGAMFQKLRTSRYMKASGRSDAAVVEFTGKVQRIARVHHYGFKEQSKPHAQIVQYPERQLLGLNRNEQNIVARLLFDWINNPLN